MVWLAVVGIGAAGIAAVTSEDEPGYTVEKVVDGDTIDVASSEGESGIRVRFLNVDTPEMTAIGTPAGCYAQEATDYLEEQLPPGTAVRLETDVEEYDRYDRLLAGVYVGDSDELVNADIARQGLGLARLYEPNDKFFDEVKKAEEEAAEAQVGLHSASSECPVLEQQRDFATDLAALTAVGAAELADMSEGDFVRHGKELNRIRRALTSGAWDGRKTQAEPGDDEDGRLIRDFVVDRAFDAEQENKRQLTKAESTWEDEQERREDIQQREAEEAAAEAKEQQRRQVEEERARQEAEEERQAAEREQAEAEQRASRAPAPTAPAVPSYTQAPAQPAAPAVPVAPSAPAGGGTDTYTGCRDYGNSLAPNATDNEGRPYTRIDCSTKLPI